MEEALRLIDASRPQKRLHAPDAQAAREFRILASLAREPGVVRTREQLLAAAFPIDALRADKYWPPVSRVDNIYGDRNLVCACPPVASYAEAAE